MVRKSSKRTYSGRVKLREKLMKNGNCSLYLDTYHGGKRSYEFLNLYLTGNKTDDAETRRMAESIRALREVELQGGRHSIVPSHMKRADFVAYFAKIAEERSKAWYHAHKYLAAFAKGPIPFDRMTPDLLEELRTYLLSQLGKNTAHLYFTVIRSGLRKAEQAGYLSDNPTKHVKTIGLSDTDKVYLTIEEVRKLAETPCRNEAVRRAFLFSCYAGLRRSDVRALRWSDIEGERMKFRPRKTRTSRSNLEYLPISPQAMEFIGDRGADTDAVFPLPSDGAITNALVKWCQKAGITKSIGFHSSRHTFATLALNSGVDIYTIKELLGHSDIRTTEIYAKLLGDNKRQAVNLIPSLRGGDDE